MQALHTMGTNCLPVDYAALRNSTTQISLCETLMPYDNKYYMQLRKARDVCPRPCIIQQYEGRMTADLGYIHNPKHGQIWYWFSSNETEVH